MDWMLDLDGVVADWTGGVLRLMAPDLDPAPIHHQLTHWNALPEALQPCFPGKTVAEVDQLMWDMIEEAGDEFWTELDVLDEGLALVEYALEHAKLTGGEFAFVTTAANHPSSAAGKVRWLKNVFGNRTVPSTGKKITRSYVFTPLKHLCSGRNRILVDDGTHNVRDWAAAGGIGFLWRQPWNAGTPHPRGRLSELDAVVRAHTIREGTF